jgi:hypothetical protein
LRDQHALVGIDQRAGDHEDEVDCSHAPDALGDEVSGPDLEPLKIPLTLFGS